ncbi:MAG: hypothetical protein IJC88_03210 [Oscillospiraceae bacterium]|nr:hypothetical protein [Oscillospiraceae bacterium]
MLTKEEIQQKLLQYYTEWFGTDDADEWYPSPAVNVWVFRRNGEYIALKCHLLNGTIEEKR